MIITGGGYPVVRLLLCLLLLCSFGAGVSYARPLPPDSIDNNTIAAFLKAAPERAKTIRKSAFERDLAAALKSTRDLDSVGVQLAPRYRLTPTLMTEFVRLWIRWVVHDEGLDFRNLAKDQAENLRAEYRKEARAAFLSIVRRSGHAAVVVECAAVVLERVDRGLHDGAVFDDLLAGAPDPEATAWIVFRATIGESRLKAYPYLARTPAFYWSMTIEDDTDFDSASGVAMLEWLEKSPAVAKLEPAALLAAQIAIKRQIIQRLWQRGLVAEGIERFEKLSPQIRALVLEEKQPSAEIVLDGKKVSLQRAVERVERGTLRDNPTFPLAVAAAYVLLDRRADAAAVLARFALAETARQFAVCWHEKGDHGECGSSDILEDWFVVDYAIGNQGDDPIEVAEFEYPTEPGWPQSGLWTLLLHRIFDAPRYGEVRQALVARWKVETSAEAAEKAKGVLESPLPPEMRARIAELRSRTAAVRARLGDVAEAKKERWLDKYRKHEVTLDSSVFRFAEAPIPATCPASAVTRNAPVPDDDAYKFVRSERAGNVIVAISLSQKFDLTGDASDGGYWVHVSRDAGRSWEPPRYTGLAEFYPYIVDAASCVPLWGGDRLNVAVTKLSLSDVSYPGPFQYKSDGRFLLTMPFSVLDGDADGDHVPDIEEDHLLLDRGKSDSDGDGINDGDDRLPNVANRNESRPRDEAVGVALRAIFHKGFRYQDTQGAAPTARSMFIEGAAADYAGIALQQKVYVYSHEDIAKLQTMTPFVTAVRFTGVIMNDDETRGIVAWEGGAVGGAFRVVRAPSGWSAVPITSYVILMSHTRRTRHP